MPYIDLAGLSRYASRQKERLERDYALLRDMQWLRTEKAGAVSLWPVGGTPLKPVVDFLFTEVPPASGEKEPDNPSTITGVSEVKVSTKGSNLFCIPPQIRTMFGVDITIGEDGIITFDGTSTHTGGNNFGIRTDFPVNVKCFPGMKIKMSFIPVSGTATSTMSDRPYNAGLQQTVFNSDGSVFRYAICTDVTQNFTHTIPENIYDSYIGPRQYLYIDKGASFDNYKFKINVELLTDAGWDVPAAWNNHAIELGGTYYGGSIDLATGVMTVTHGMVIFDGTGGNWSLKHRTNCTYFNLVTDIFPGRKAGANINGVSSHFPRLYNSNFDTVGFGFFGTSIGGYFLYPDNAATSSDFNAFLAAQYANDTPVTVVYELATPIIVQLSPTQILSLPQADKYTPRINTVYTDAQAVQVGYVKSPIREEQELTQAIVAQGGNV